MSYRDSKSVVHPVLDQTEFQITSAWQKDLRSTSGTATTDIQICDLDSTEQLKNFAIKEQSLKKKTRQKTADKTFLCQVMYSSRRMADK